VKPRKAAMVGRLYEVPTRTEANSTSGRRGPWQVFEGGLVRVVVQGAGWPTNVLAERVKPWTEFVTPNVVHTWRSGRNDRGEWCSGIVYEGRFYEYFQHGGVVMVVTGERFVRPARGMRKIA
jgi:hypothetical protein